MALQGTLDTFALPDVLRLLAATKKSGRLSIDGSRGQGVVEVADGAVTSIAAHAAPYAVERVDALFELLRFVDGAFTFDAEAPVATVEGVDVEELLAGAEAVLAEWREIEAVVPSLDVTARLRRALASDSVTIPAASWEILSQVGGGTTVRGLGQALDLEELPVSRIVRDLVELGVVELTDGPAADLAEPEPAPEPVPEPMPEPEVLPPVAEISLVEASGEPEPAPADLAAGSLPVARPIKARKKAQGAEPSVEPEVEIDRFIPIDLPAGIGDSGPAVAAESSGEPAVDDLAAAFPGLAQTSAEPSEDELELARQLSTLSPRAADAVRAAAEAETAEERDAALDEATEDGPINRGLLLKFLSSVKS